MPVTNGQLFNDLSAVTVPTGEGLFLSPTRLDAPVGSLTNVRNFEVVDGAYEETQGLTIVGPSIDEGLQDFWHADVAAGDCTVSGALTKGDLLYWYESDGLTVAGTGRMYYAYADATNIYITLDKVAGTTPRRATKFYTSSGSTLEFTGTGDFFVYQTELELEWNEYKGAKFLGALTSSQREVDDTWDSFKPDPLGVRGISGVFQYRDDVYAVRDFWGGYFEEGTNAPDIGDIIEVNYGSVAGSFRAHVGQVELHSGSWEEGDASGYLYLYPSAGTTLDMDQLANWDGGTTIVNNSKTENVGVTGGLGVKQYQNKGLLWKLDNDQRQGGWRYVDTGYSLSFERGATAPIAEVTPLVVSDKVPSIQDTGFTDLVSPATEFPTTGTYSAWSNLGNVDSSTPAAYASTSVAIGDYSRVMELDLPADLMADEVRILGVEVTVMCHQTVGTDVRINKVQLKNDNGGDQYLSANRATNDYLTTTPGTEYSYGAQLDTWELDKIDNADIASDKYSLLLQFENTGNTLARTVNVDQVQIKVHYVVTGQQVYLHDGTSDVSTALIHTYQVFDGEWSEDTAEGWMTLYDVSSPASTIPGLGIYTGALGTGDLIGYTRTLTKNLLPSLDEQDALGVIYQHRTATFSGNEDDSIAFVATGSSPAFMLNQDDRFSFIRMPIDRDKDKPKYVEFHRNHLMLSAGSHFMVSSVGTPNNFNTYDGATSWNPKDTITGFAAAANGSTMVTCEDSIHHFRGSGASGQDAFALGIVTDNSGARPYTVSNLLGNVFVDYAGITTADISDKYGGFDIGRRSAHIRTLLRELLGSNSYDLVAGNRIVGAIPVRKKNQYRIYLANGDIITATFADDGSLKFTRQHYTAYHAGDTRGYESLFVPTALSSSVISNGEERILMGTRLGHVMRIDPGYLDILSYANKSTAEAERRDTLSSWKFFKFVDFNPLHAPDPAAATKFFSADVYIEHSGDTYLNHVAETDYDKMSEQPAIGQEGLTVGTTTGIGDYDTFPGKEVDDYFTWHINTTTDGLTMRLSKFGGVGAMPLRINSLFVRAEVKGDNISHKKGRRYSVRDAALPQDIVIEGVTGTADFAGTQGTVTLDYTVTGTTGTATFAGTTGTVVFGPNIWTMDATFTLDSGTHYWDGKQP